MPVSWLSTFRWARVHAELLEPRADVSRSDQAKFENPLEETQQD